MGFIYMLTFPSEKSYIGQTIRDIHKRLEEHQWPNSKCVAVYNAIKKYGWEKVKIDWYEVPNEDLNKHEELMVEVLGTLSPGGYNLREGGGSKGRPSEETKEKISESMTGEKNHMFEKTHTEPNKNREKQRLERRTPLSPRKKLRKQCQVIRITHPRKCINTILMARMSGHMVQVGKQHKLLERLMDLI